MRKAQKKSTLSKSPDRADAWCLAAAGPLVFGRYREAPAEAPSQRKPSLETYALGDVDEYSLSRLDG